MPRQKSVKNDDDLYSSEDAIALQEERELARSMECRGYASMSDGTYRRESRVLSDEIADAY